MGLKTPTLDLVCIGCIFCGEEWGGEEWLTKPGDWPETRAIITGLWGIIVEVVLVGGENWLVTLGVEGEDEIIGILALGKVSTMGETTDLLLVAGNKPWKGYFNSLKATSLETYKWPLGDKHL